MMEWSDGSQREYTPITRAWTVLAATFEGEHRYAQAQACADLLSRKAGVKQVWMEESQGTTNLYAGQFRTRSEADAKEALERIEKLELNNRRVFKDAEFAPLAGDVAPADPFDLNGYPHRYSLQIAVYDPNFGKHFRDAAEQAVHTLREEGVEAYYYHGPNRSLVTVGLFTDRDFVWRPDGQRAYGPAVTALQERYPNNLLNGRTIEESIEGQSIGAQPSFLVRAN